MVGYIVSAEDSLVADRIADVSACGRIAAEHCHILVNDECLLGISCGCCHLVRNGYVFVFIFRRYLSRNESIGNICSCSDIDDVAFLRLCQRVGEGGGICPAESVGFCRS